MTVVLMRRCEPFPRLETKRLNECGPDHHGFDEGQGCSAANLASARFFLFRSSLIGSANGKRWTCNGGVGWWQALVERACLS